MARKPDIYVSVDIEADGPVPSLYSMLSLGAAAFERGSRTPIAKFEVNLKPLRGAKQDPDTMKWWTGQQEAWAHVTLDPLAPWKAMKKFRAWIKKLPGNPILVVFPSWDHQWVHWYMIRYGGNSPFGVAALDIKSLVMGIQNQKRFKDVTKRRLPMDWFLGAPKHSHKALEDAIEQGVVLINALAHMDGVPARL